MVFTEASSSLKMESGRPVNGSIVLTNGVENVPAEEGEPKEKDKPKENSETGKDDLKETEKEDEPEPNKADEDGEKRTILPPTKEPSSSDPGLEIDSNEATSGPPKLDPPNDPKFLDEPSDSRSQREWKRQKRDGARNKAIDKIMDLVGEENVKSHVLKAKGMVDTARKQGVDLSKDRFSVAFVGNSGKGKFLTC